MIERSLRHFALLPLYVLLASSFLLATLLHLASHGGLLFFKTVLENLGAIGAAIIFGLLALHISNLF